MPKQTVTLWPLDFQLSKNQKAVSTKPIVVERVCFSVGVCCEHLKILVNSTPEAKRADTVQKYQRHSVDRIPKYTNTK